LNQILDALLERSKAQKLAILGVTIILITALYYSFLYSPQSDEIAKLADSVEIARNEKSVKTQKAANLARLKQDLQLLDAQLKKAIAQLPEKREIPGLLSSISTKAQQSGLDILLFRPRAETFQEFYAEIPVDITVKGNFHNTVGFFDEVGRMNRLVNIDNIGFKNPTVNGDNVVLETTSVATAFRFLDDAERKKIADERAKAAKTKNNR
jgi:type IV pilus assembly protein PilO